MLISTAEAASPTRSSRLSLPQVSRDNTLSDEHTDSPARPRAPQNSRKQQLEEIFGSNSESSLSGSDTDSQAENGSQVDQSTSFPNTRLRRRLNLAQNAQVYFDQDVQEHDGNNDEDDDYAPSD